MRHDVPLLKELQNIVKINVLIPRANGFCKELQKKKTQEITNLALERIGRFASPETLGFSKGLRDGIANRS